MYGFVMSAAANLLSVSKISGKGKLHMFDRYGVINVVFVFVENHEVNITGISSAYKQWQHGRLTGRHVGGIFKLDQYGKTFPL